MNKPEVQNGLLCWCPSWERASWWISCGTANSDWQCGTEYIIVSVVSLICDILVRELGPPSHLVGPYGVVKGWLSCLYLWVEQSFTTYDVQVDRGDRGYFYMSDKIGGIALYKDQMLQMEESWSQLHNYICFWPWKYWTKTSFIPNIS